MTSNAPGCDSMNKMSTNGQLLSSECTSSASLAKYRSGARLPPDFLEKRWVQILRMVFGPIHPGYLICSILVLSILLLFFAIGVLGWVFMHLLASVICISAFAISTVTFLADTEYRVPDCRLPFEEVKKDLETRDTMQGIAIIVGFVLFPVLGGLSSGLLGAFAAFAFYFGGIFATFLYLGVTSRVHLCAYCNQPAVFRKLRDRWTCVVCGKPR